MKWDIIVFWLLLFGMLLLGAYVVGFNDSSQNVTLAPTPSLEESAGYCGDNVVQYSETCSTCSIDAGICPVETPPAFMSQQVQTEQLTPIPASVPLSPNQ